MLLSCSGGESDLDFSSRDDALSCFQSFSRNLNHLKSLSAEKASSLLREWQTLRDTVASYLEKDAAGSGKTSLGYPFSSTDDVIRRVILEKMQQQGFTLRDVAIIKHDSSLFPDDEDVIRKEKDIRSFFSRLDTVELRDYGKERTLSLYGTMLDRFVRDGIDTTDELLSFLSAEDVLFRMFLSHLHEYDEDNIGDITYATERVCGSIFRAALDSRLDFEETLLLMTMRTNRRILMNAVECVEGLRKKTDMSPIKRESYCWMAMQPFISIERLGMTLLSEDELDTMFRIADALETLGREGKLGEDSSVLPAAVDIILRAFIDSI